MSLVSSARARVALAGLVLWGVATSGALPAARPASGALCGATTLTYLGSPYRGAGAIRAQDFGDQVGPGAFPPCEGTPSLVGLKRVDGVAPRFAVALPGGRGAMLFVADASACRRATTRRALACLRARTRRLIEGPALVAYPSAEAGGQVHLGVHVRDPSLRRRLAFGTEALLQRPEGRRWRSLFRLRFPRPGQTAPPEPVVVGTTGDGRRPLVGALGKTPRAVRLPLVAPGQYRIATQVRVGSRTRWLFVSLTILAPAAASCAAPCVHA